MRTETPSGTCRLMETRTCPPAGPCAELCARFESDDPRPWLTDGIWTVAGEFAVCLPEGWTPVCAEHLPVLVRRVHRHGQAAVVGPGDGSPCRVVEPHPAIGAGVPVDGATCPRPLYGLCASGECDHD